MSMTLYTIEEAAQHLERSERAIRDYVKRGWLTQVKKTGDRRRYYDPAEVEELRISLSRGRVSVTQEEFAALRGKVRRLEATLDVVLRVLDAKDEPLSVTADYGRQLFVLCLDQLRRGGWAVQEMAPWSEVFLRLDETDIATVAAVVEDARPWLPFLRLCTAMTASVVRMPEYKSDLELQALHKKLAEGRRRLRMAAVIFSESRGAVEPDLAKFSEYQIPSTVGDLLETLLRRKR